MAKPRHLTLRVAARGALRGDDRIVELNLAPQVRQEFGKAHRLHCRQVGIKTAGGQRRRLAECARLDHPGETRVAGGIKPVPRRGEQYRPKAVGLWASCSLLPIPDRYAGGPYHLKGADQPLLVSREESLGSGRIELRQPLAKRHTAQSAMERDRFLPDLLGNFRNRREAVFEGAKIKSRAADKNGKAARLCGGGDLVEREGAPPRGGAALAGVEKAIEPVRHPPLGGLVGTRRQNAEIAIALQAVGIDDNAAQDVRQIESECRFPARRRTGDGEDRRRTATPGATRLVTGTVGGVGRGPMNMVLTLIAGAHGASRLPRLVAVIAGALGITAEPVWLAPGEACDLVFDDLGSAAVEGAARALIDNGDIDVLVQPLAERRKRLLVADMESTIIENEMLDELADFLGLRLQISEITHRAMNGEIDFVAALEARVALLAGVEHRVLEAATARIRLTPGARALIATMRAAGAVTALVSGGFTIFAEQVAAELGFDRVVANRLDVTAGRIAGTVRQPIVTGETKRQTLLALAAEHNIPLQRTMAVGDGANDLPMLATAGTGIAFRAKPMVASTARWRIDNADLTGLLYAQGYRSDEIIR